MPKKEEKKKEDEETQEKATEADTPVVSDESKQTDEEKEIDTKPISELAEEAAKKENEPESEKPEVEISMTPVSASDTPDMITPESRQVSADSNPPTPSETLPIDQITEQKSVQETYPLADEIEKDGIKKKSLFSSFLLFRNKKGKIILLILVVLLVVALGIGTIMNTNNEKLSFMKLNNKARETVVLSPTQAPSPTPIPVTVDKASLKIQVQNGSGESGVAGKMKDFLIEKGYEGTIDTGNADNYEYTKTVIKVKKTKVSVEEELRTDVSENYTISEEKEELEDTSDYDAIVIVGTE